MKCCWSLSTLVAHFLRDSEGARHSLMLGEAEVFYMRAVKVGERLQSPSIHSCGTLVYGTCTLQTEAVCTCYRKAMLIRYASLK